ncbi:MAG TPA: recombinase family protein [Pirellulales bacterium]|nr:recombinase family protein [Pirellulales bacterium]
MYVRWAQGLCLELGVKFRGTAEQIEAMIHDSRSADGDIFLDYEVEGDQLTRPALEALLQEAKRDSRVSHIFIPRRDRLARPHDPIDGLNIEKKFRELGITLVFTNKTLAPLARGERPKIEEQLVALIDYSHAGEENWTLADKILKAQLSLAEAGYSTGGRPRYGFDRCLVKADGTRIRKLADGERVRQSGHHVVWLPANDQRFQIGLRILDMLEQIPASRVAAILTADGIPSPDAGRYRKDNGMRHLVSGVWHATTITNIARNPLWLACKMYGQRSMGKLLRFTPDGPRLVSEESDYRLDGKRKVIRNQSPISAAAHFEPPVNRDRLERLLAKLDERAGSQKGKPRSRDPNNNPLGARIFDMNCSWPMYRSPNGDSFRYCCGQYMQSHGQRCDSNYVLGPAATQFVLGYIRQQVISPRMLSKIENKLRELAARDGYAQKPASGTSAQKTELATVVANLDAVKRLKDLPQDEAQRSTMVALAKNLQERHDALVAEIAASEVEATAVVDTEAEVKKALMLVCQIDKLATDSENLAAVTKLFNLVNARLFLRFVAVRPKKRVVNRICGGIVTFGSAPAPIEIYCGQTSRKHIKNSQTAADAVAPGEKTLPGSFQSDGKDESIGNVNRGERI